MPDFKQQLAEYVELIQRELPGFLPTGDDLPYQNVVDAMGYSLLSGGKRIRGVLVLAFYRLLREDVEKAVPFAAAVEMVHAYSLIHDDLPCMDDDDTRRGKPSCHIAFGEATALLAGDALLNRAFEVMLGERVTEQLPADRVLPAARCLADAAGANGMIGGQVMDLQNEDKQLTAAELDAINRRKTGALIRASCEMGCILGGGDSGLLEAAGQYAGKVGLAFQIQDDILDCEGDPALLGKPVGSDAENHKSTYPAVYGMEKSRQIVRGLSDEAKNSIAARGRDTAFLCELADMLSGRNY